MKSSFMGDIFKLFALNSLIISERAQRFIQKIPI
jgi:hypothetical protein